MPDYINPEAPTVQANPAPEENFDLFTAANVPQAKLAATGLKRYLQLGIRGATLGYAGTQIPPEGVGEHVAEFVGGMAPAVAASIVTSPLGGAVARTVPILNTPRVLPIASRMIGATGSGAVIGGVQSLVAGTNPLEGAAEGAAQFAAAEGAFIGGSTLLGKALKVPPVGKRLIPSPIDNPAAAEIAAGQGIAPEFPPNLRQPNVMSTGVFDSKMYVGAATLNPDRNPQVKVRTMSDLMQQQMGARAYQPVAPEAATRPRTIDDLVQSFREAAPPLPPPPMTTEGRLLAPGERTRSMLGPGPPGPLALPEGRPPLALPPGPEPRVQAPPAGPSTEGRILGPAERTRSMLPEGRPPLALPEGRGAPPATEGPMPGYFETGYHPGFEVSRPPEIGYFETAYDPRIGETVLIPKVPQVEEAMAIAKGLDPRTQGELPLSPGQVRYMKEVNPKLDRQLDTVSKRESSLTDNLVKQPEIVAEAAIEGARTPTMEFHAVELSPAGLEARTLLSRSNIPEEEFVAFGSTLRGTRDQKMNALLDWLRTRCR